MVTGDVTMPYHLLSVLFIHTDGVTATLVLRWGGTRLKYVLI